MGSMKWPGLVVVVLSAALMSSCSWAKHRYQRIRAHIHMPHLPKLRKKQETASLARIQPSRAQQAEARRLLMSMAQPPRTQATGGGYEQDLMEQLMTPEGAMPLPTTGGHEAAVHTTIAAPQTASPFAAPQLTLPAATASHAAPPAFEPTITYPDRHFVPRGAPLPAEMQDENSARLQPEPDAAARHGLRSPSLPKNLPMDIDGKLNSPSTL